MQISKLLSKDFFLIFVFSLFIFNFSSSEENTATDIWNLDKEKKNDNVLKIEELTVQSEKENISINISNIDDIDEDTIDTSNNKLIGIFDPKENMLNIDMWSNSDGDQVKVILKKLMNTNLSTDSNEILKIALLTNAYPPTDKMSSEEFFSFQKDFLIKSNDLNLIKEFLSKNKNLFNSDAISTHYVNSNLIDKNLKASCDLFEQNKNLYSSNYLDKFKIYCLLINDKREEAQIIFDLKKELGFKDTFFENKFNILMGYENKKNNKISESNILDFHISRETVDQFEYEPNNKTSKDIWKYLSNYNLLQKINDIDIEDSIKVQTIEKAAHNGNYSEKELLNLYKRFEFNLDQLLTAEDTYKKMPNYMGRALLYQRLLLTYDVAIRLELAEKIKNSVKKDNIENAFNLELASILSEIDAKDVPAKHTTFYNENKFEKFNVSKNIKFNNKILHQSKLLNYFIKDLQIDVISKETNEMLKKIKADKKYTFTSKDKILMDSLIYDGVKLQKKYQNLYERDPDVPTDLQVLVNNLDTGMILLRLAEIIGEDEINDLGTETLYFITTVLNQANLDGIRNKMLLKVLPNKI